MKKNKKRLLCLALAIVMLLGVFSGCTKKDTNNDGEVSSDEQTDIKDKTDSKDDNSEASDDALKLPIVDKPLKLSLYSSLHPTEAKYANNLDENEAIKKVQEITGIDIEFIHPPVGQEEEQFNIMVASGELPDIVKGFFDSYYKGGVEAAMNDGLLINVNDLVEQHAPNFKKDVLSNELYNKLVKADDGTIIRFGATVIPTLDGEKGRAYVGPVLRKDLLDELGLEVPETIDEWYKVLTAFKESGKVKIPLAWAHKDWDTIVHAGNFIGAYGVNNSFYREGETVKYGPIESGYKDFLLTFNKWYNEGLLDPDFATHGYWDNLTPMLMAGDVGSACIHLWEYRTYYETVIQKENPKAELVVAPYTVLNKGDKFNFADSYHGLSGGLYITTSCKHPVEATKLIDFSYTPEATRMMNWGIEGVTYDMVDGKPQRTKEMEENHMEMTYKYTSFVFRGFVDWDQNDSQYPYDLQHQAWDVWSDSTIKGVLPQGMIKTEEESTKFGSVMTEIESYVDEMFLKFIMGLEPIDKFDEYVAQVKSMGIDDAIKIQQDSLDRYNARK